MFKPSLFLLFLWFLLSPTAYSGPIDGSVSTGLRKMKINQLNQVGGHAGTNEGNVRRNDGVHGNLRCSDNDIITLNNCMDALYHGEISSSNLWVPSAKCYFSDKFDDIPGLGFQDISVGDVVPVWYNMVQQGLIPELVFSCWLNRNAKADEGGKLVSGEVDTNHFNDEQTYVAVTQKGYWSVIADSLTSMLVGPKGIVRRPPKRGPISSGGPGQTN